MTQRITVDPVTRIEGHLSIDLEYDAGRVSAAYSKGEMFRGFEMLLRGRDPMDAHQITQRICGVCPISHGIASATAQDDAYGITPTKNGRILRNLLLGANYIQSHIIHFYHLSALDFIDVAAILTYKGADPTLSGFRDWVRQQVDSGTAFPAAPFLPRFEGNYLPNRDINISAISHYLDALEMRQIAHEAVALFGGKAPHATSIIPGGITERATIDKIAGYKHRMRTLQRFIDNVYLADVEAVASAFPDYWNMARGCGNFLAYDAFPENNNASQHLFSGGVLIDGDYSAVNAQMISEEVKHSFFSSTSGLHPSKGSTVPNPNKRDAYTWIKAPRYNGSVMEVGPLARMLTNYAGGNAKVKNAFDSILSRLGLAQSKLVSVMGRHLARAIECKIVADRCAEWVDQLHPDQPSYTDFTIPETGQGVGLTEAPRGALGHWITIKDKKIDNYQCVVPTTWNCSPRGDDGQPGAIEQALEGIPIADSANPLEAMRVVRSFDPCLACAVH